MFADEISGGEVVDLFSFHRFVEVEIEIFQAFLISEGGRFGAAFDLTVDADYQFIFEDQFQEFGVVQLRGSRFLQTYFKCLQQATESELFELFTKIGIHHFVPFERRSENRQSNPTTVE